MILIKNAERLKEDLKAENCSLANIAKETKFSKTYIHYMLCGKRKMNEKVAIKICELVNKSFDYYFFIQSVNKNETVGGDLICQKKIEKP